MLPLFRLILLLACLGAARAQLQTPAISPSSNSPGALPQARITGRVVLADSHNPARNAVVILTSLDGMNRQFIRVGLEGTYLFEHVVPGEYIVITYLDGYLSPFDKIVRSLADTSIAQLFAKIVAAQGSVRVGAQGTQTVDISLERGAIVSGRVHYSDGLPAIQAGIELQDTSAPISRPGAPYIQLGDIARSEFVHQSFETDDQGRFRIAGVRPGVYRIAAVQPIKEPKQNWDFLIRSFFGALHIAAVQPIKEPKQNWDFLIRSFFGALHFYTNDTVHPNSAKTYTLVAGQELSDLEIRIPLDGFHNVRGKVVAPDGRSITNAEVTITETSDPSLFFTTGVSDGSFRFDRLPPGMYNVAAPWGNIAPAGGKAAAAFGSGSTTFALKDKDLTGVTLTLPEAPLPVVPLLR